MITPDDQNKNVTQLIHEVNATSKDTPNLASNSKTSMNQDSQTILANKNLKSFFIINCSSGHVERLMDYIMLKYGIRFLHMKEMEEGEHAFIRQAESLDDFAFKKFALELYENEHVIIVASRFYICQHHHTTEEPDNFRYLKPFFHTLHSYRLQTYPQENFPEKIIKFAKFQWNMSFSARTFSHVLSIVRVDSSNYYWGICAKDLYYEKDNDKIASLRSVSRACSKLLESIERVNLKIQNNWKCIDVGG